MPHRIERVNSLIRQEISELLRREVKDPRLGNFIAVTEVDTSRDLKHAHIYVSYLGTEEEKQETMTFPSAWWKISSKRSITVVSEGVYPARLLFVLSEKSAKTPRLPYSAIVGKSMT